MRCLTILAIASTLFMAVTAHSGNSQIGAKPVVLGPVVDVATIARFGTDPTGDWTAQCGQNVHFALTAGVRLPGIAVPVLAAEAKVIDQRDRIGSHTWFSLDSKKLRMPDLPADADGFRIVLGSLREAQWWISPTFTTDTGETYSLVLDSCVFPSGKLFQWVLPFDRFHTAKNEPITLDKARKIRAVSFGTSSAGTSLLFNCITVYHRDRLQSWLDFRTDHPDNNLFQRADTVGVTFTPGGIVSAKAFRYEVRDYDGKLTARGSIALSSSNASGYSLPAAAYKPGYYEVRAYWTGPDGKDLAPYSAVRAEGTVPDGLGTFCVLPNTIAENRSRSTKLGENAFFGLHGDFLGLGDLLGTTWCFDYSGWVYVETIRPDRTAGIAPWATAALARPQEPTHRSHIQPFGFNLSGSIPSWARTDGGAAPGFIWADALALLRDTVKVNRHIYPQMSHRLYGGLWEVDLNSEPYGQQKPVYTPADIVDAYRRFREVVRSEDPQGLLIGPCSSVIRPDWFEDQFKAGVLDWVDGIETHAYCESTLTPEADDLPGRIRKLNQLVLKYHHGSPLPIYVTEAGQPGIVGTEPVYRSQAERMVRASIILKGEGVRVFQPFYGIDYDRIGYWGFLYNLDVDSPSGPWSTHRTSPKPMVSAVAVCINMLEGTQSVGDVSARTTGVWQYRFRRGHQTITAIWSPNGKQQVRLTASGMTVEVVDLMGRANHAPVKQHQVLLDIGEAPMYVVDGKP